MTERSWYFRCTSLNSMDQSLAGGSTSYALLRGAIVGATLKHCSAVYKCQVGLNSEPAIRDIPYHHHHFHLLLLTFTSPHIYHPHSFYAPTLTKLTYISSTFCIANYDCSLSSCNACNSLQHENMEMHFLWWVAAWGQLPNELWDDYAAIRWSAAHLEQMPAKTT